MRLIILSVVSFCLLCQQAAQAELRVIGLRVTTDAGSETRVSIYSEVPEENKDEIKVKEAVTLVGAAKGWGSAVKVGVVAHDVALDRYLPLLVAISKNHWLELAFVEGEKPDFVHDNIRGLIKQRDGNTSAGVLRKKEEASSREHE